MSLLDFSCLCMFIIFAQLTESRVLILRDYDDEPLVLGHVDSSSAQEVKHMHQPTSSNYKPKRTHSKRTVLQYGRHIYHLDNFANLKDLRSKMTQLKPDSVDIDDLFRVSDLAKQGVGDYLRDLLKFSNAPVQCCSGNQCNEDLRKFSKHKNDDDTDLKHKKMQFGRSKRFQIVDNRHESKKHDDSSEEHHEKKKKKFNKKKKIKHYSESSESKSKESGSAEESGGSHKKPKKKYKQPKESSEESVEIKRKSKKKHNEDDSSDASVETFKKNNKYSKSNEDFHKKKKKKNKHNYGASDETKRKTFAVEDDFFMQGNKIFHAKVGKNKKKHYDFDKRRRLEHFLPKRYHWDPSEIHDLGYYWFNGPKGKFAAPTLL